MSHRIPPRKLALATTLLGILLTGVTPILHAGQSKGQMQIKVTVIAQCTVRVDHSRPRSIICAGSRTQTQQDMRVEWEQFADTPHLLHANVSF